MLADARRHGVVVRGPCVNASLGHATLEDHGLLGGFGAAIAEWLVDSPTHRTPLWRCGTPEVFTGETLDANSRRATLEPSRLAAQILKQLRRRRKLAA